MKNIFAMTRPELIDALRYYISKVELDVYLGASTAMIRSRLAYEISPTEDKARRVFFWVGTERVRSKPDRIIRVDDSHNVVSIEVL